MIPQLLLSELSKSAIFSFQPSEESESLKVHASEDVTVLGKPDERRREIDDVMRAKMSVMGGISILLYRE